MAENKEAQAFLLDNYVFETKSEYDSAMQEKKGVKYLSSQLDINNTEKVYKLYDELVEKKIFSTPIGIDYLKQLRQAVLSDGMYSADMVRPIPVIALKTQEKDKVEKHISTHYEADVKRYEKANKTLKAKLKTAVIFNVVLAIMVAFMFYISKSSSNPNIINYERVIQDKYAHWEQDLKEREQKIKDKEWELNKLDASSQN